MRLIDGVVIDTSDPLEMGRLKVWCPAIDGQVINADSIPWALYVSPLGGQAFSYPAGGSGAASVGPVSYGFWAVPKVGAEVLIGFLYDSQRVFLGCLHRGYANRGLPTGRNADGAAPLSDSYDDIEPARSNLQAQFGDLSSSIARTRGAYERQAGQAADVKTVDEGYEPRVVPAPFSGESTLDPQTYCITTPGRHTILLQDNPKNSRVRVRTAEGTQVLLDDANERIYVSTAGGNAWVEIDRDGHIHVYGGASVSVSAGEDLNLQAKRNVNISAGGNLNLQATGYLRGSACADVSLSGDGGVNLTSGAAFNILAAGTMLQTADTIHLNGATAASAPCADSPSITPTHEPFKRPTTKGHRGPHWRE